MKVSAFLSTDAGDSSTEIIMSLSDLVSETYIIEIDNNINRECEKKSVKLIPSMIE